jgi:hypothetical protein
LVVGTWVGLGVAVSVGVACATVVVGVAGGVVVGSIVVFELSVPPHPATSKATANQEIFSKAVVPVLAVLIASFDLAESDSTQGEYALSPAALGPERLDSVSLAFLTPPGL